MTAIMHITTQLNDHTAAVSLCGIRFVTDHAATDRARASGSWISCPLCEAANMLDHPVSEPETPKHKNRPHGGWTQPTLEI